MRVIVASAAAAIISVLGFNAFAEIGHGVDYDCKGNDGYGQLGDMEKEQFWFGALKGFSSQTYCYDINQKLGFENPDQMIKCTIISRDKDGKMLPPNKVWDDYYTKDWTDHMGDKRDCNRPSHEACGVSTANGIGVMDGAMAMKPGFPFDCKECKAEFLSKVKHIDCELDTSITDHKNRLVLEGDHLIIKAAPRSDGNDSSGIISDMDQIFPTVPKYFERKGYTH